MLNRFYRKVILILGIVWCCVPVWTLAASLNNVRYHSGSEHDRLVFDWSEMPLYNVQVANNGQKLVFDFAEATGQKIAAGYKSSRLASVEYKQKGKHILVTLNLKAGMTYKINNLHDPARVFVDILPRNVQKKPAVSKKTSPKTKPIANSSENLGNITALNFDGLYTELAAPGIAKRKYVYWDDDGQVTAYFVEADKNLYTLKPVLARGMVPGLQTTSAMSDAHDAVAAINATYFAGNGDMIGMVKIAGQMAGTTYYRRTALGLTADGRPVMDEISYHGAVTIGAVTLPVAGIDCERGADSLVLYNKWYGPHTRTNEYGKEYTVRQGKVVAISTGDSKIPADGVVVSVHGTAAAALADVKIGDNVQIAQDLGYKWNNVPDIMGAGPRLVQAGNINVTAAAEEFPGDIRYGRAPRSAVAILNNGNYLFGVVDGRQKSSHGLTLTEWAKLLQKFGAREAMNLDGGGSSELVIGGEIQNSPSDGHERNVGSALIIVKK